MKARRSALNHGVELSNLDMHPVTAHAVLKELPPFERTIPDAAAALPAVRVVIADSHPLFRDGLRRVLEAQGDFSIVGEAADGNEAIRLVHETAPDVLLLDLATRACPGVDVLQELHRARIDVKILLLASTIDAADKIRSLRMGIRGIVMKETPTPLLLKSVRVVARGGYWVEREMVADLVRALAEGPPVRRHLAARQWSITKREREILVHVVGGNGNREIALKCGISEDTVKHHLTSLFDKTGMSNRLELALFALHHRLVECPKPRRS